MDRTLTSRPILAILLEKILQERSERKVQQSISPGHCAELQSVTSVELPSQSSRPGWWQARALIFRPLPQELVHVDQSPHSCQAWATGRISSGERFSISSSSLSLLALRCWLRKNLTRQSMFATCLKYQNKQPLAEKDKKHNWSIPGKVDLHLEGRSPKRQLIKSLY